MTSTQRKRRAPRRVDSSERLFRMAMIGVGLGMLCGALIAPDQQGGDGPLTALVRAFDRPEAPAGE